MNYGYIYKTTNLINGRIYIGQHTGSFTHNYLGSGKLIIRALRKYGKDNFRLEIIAYASTREMLHSLEIEHIEKYRNLCGVGFLYNITKGGTGNPRTEETKEKISLSNKGRKLSEEHKKKLSEIHKGRKHKHHSKETKEKLRQSHFRHKSDCKCGVCKRQRGEAIEHKIECKCSHCKSIRGEIKWSDETNKKRSQSLLGHSFYGKRIHSKETCKLISSKKIGHKVNKETRIKISKANTGYKHSKEAKLKISKALIKYQFFRKQKNNDTQATGSNIVPPLIGAQNRSQEKHVRVVQNTIVI